MDGGIVRNCVVSYNTSDGIVVTQGVLVKDNVSKSNALAGIHVTGTRNRIEGNNVTDNISSDDWGTYGSGIQVGDSHNVIVNNTTTFNRVDFDIVPGNVVGAIEGGMATKPWSNVTY